MYIFILNYTANCPLSSPAKDSERYIESSSAKIEDEDVTFARNILVETVGDRSSRGSLMIRRMFITGNEKNIALT